jgi:hypothetical protein
VLLALDISLTTGAAWGRVGEARPRTAVIKLPAKEENFDRALVGLREWVAMTCRFEKVEFCLVEAALRVVDSEHSDYSAFLLTSLSAVAREAAKRAGAHVEAVKCDDWRKHFLGTARVSTEEGKRGAKKRCDQLGYTYQDHNAAEAAGVWDYGIARHFRRSGLIAG